MEVRWFEETDIEHNEVGHILDARGMRIAKILLGGEFKEPHVTLGGFGVYTASTGRDFLALLKQNVMSYLFHAIGFGHKSDKITGEMSRQVDMAAFEIECYKALALAIELFESNPPELNPPEKKRK